MSKSTLLNQNGTKLLIDVVAFVGFLIAMDPRSTGIAIHEWLTLAGIGVIIVHLLLNWSWIVEITRRFFGKVTGRSRINYILNIALFIDMTLIMFTGIMISESALPALGISLPKSMIWRALHSTTADLFVPILGLHLALHWSWLVSTIKRFVVQPVAGVFTTKQTSTNPEVKA
ncbi:MAG: DUF4405 domain-containing protein [Chloroflexota bacterium]